MRGRGQIIEVDYGEYPQSILRASEEADFERAFQSGRINRTGKKYTTDTISNRGYSLSFAAREHMEYEYNGKKCIRFVADGNNSGL